ncbi:MAG: TRAFs-binding domain-containing protein [Bacteroidota bacterium]|jgi:hypothetical protein|nr:TRAFs-binding domain-containing protein [Cytophagales bacterium]
METALDHIESLINQGRYFEAKAQAFVLHKELPSLRLQQLCALSLSKCGVPEAALMFLKPIYDKDPNDPETAGILGGIYKELFIKSKSQPYAILARDTYRKNFIATKSYYTGINAATLSAITGQSKIAQQTANEVLALLPSQNLTFWQEATKAEAQFIAKDRLQAQASYFRVRELAGNDWGKVNSIYNQLWLLNHYISVPQELLQIFKPPVTVAFVGHMIDHPNRRQSRFPQSIENNIKDALVTQINNLNAKVGYCSLACGGDILFAEAMAESGGEVNIHLPFCEEDFLDASVRFAGGDWEERFRRLTQQFPVTYFTQGHYRDHPDLFFYQTAVIFGSTLMHSREKPHLITVLSERDKQRKEGGTLDTLKLWPYPELVINVNPDKFFSPQHHSEEPRKETTPTKNDTPVLFLMAVDFPDTNPEEKEELWKSINTRVETLQLTPTVIQWSESTVWVAHLSASRVIEIFELMAEVVLRFHTPNNLRTALHLGIASVDEPLFFTSEAVVVLSEVHRHALPAQGLATEPAAAALMLATGNRNISYVSKLATSGSSDEISIYAIG